MRYITPTVLLALLGATAACSDTDPVEAEFGSATAVVTDDASAAGALRSGEGQSLRTQAPSTFSGAFTGEARVSISASGESWVELGAPSEVDVALQSSGDESTVHAGATVPAATYTRVRLTLSGARAQVNAGAVLDGLTVAGAVVIRVGGTDNRIVIEKEVQPFTVDAETEARIRFDLNSEAWVHEESARDESADDDEVRESAVASRTLLRDP